MNRNDFNNREREAASLDEVLDDYMSSSSELDYPTMMNWIKRYPQYKDDIVNFTLHTTMIDTTPPTVEETDLVYLEVAASRQMSFVRELVAQYNPATVELTGLIIEGKARGITLKAFADTLGLSVALLNKLDRRLVTYQSIPREIIGEVAKVLNHPLEAVARYLQGPALHAVGANYKASEAPSLPDQQDFSDAVQDDRSLGHDRKRQLLEMAKTDND